MSLLSTFIRLPFKEFVKQVSYKSLKQNLLKLRPTFQITANILYICIVVM